VLCGYTLLCRICREPPKCIALCDAKIFYVHGKESSQRVCIHIGTYQHPMKVKNYKDSRKRINALLEEHVDRSPQATYSKIVLEASMDIIGNFLLSGENDTQCLLSLKELEPMFDSCRELNSPNLRKKVSSFKYLRRFDVMDGIAKLRGVSIGPTSNGSNSHDKVTIRTRCSSSRCRKLVLEVEWIWFDVCNQVGTLRMRG
jgi:hypothetical protein